MTQTMFSSGVSLEFAAERDFPGDGAWGRFRTWLAGAVSRDDDLTVLHDFAERVRVEVSAQAVRSALVLTAVRLTRASRVELELEEEPGGRPRLVASWPEPEVLPTTDEHDPSLARRSWRAGAIPPRPRQAARGAGATLGLPIRIDGRNRGVLRLWRTDGKAWPHRTVRILTTLTVLAASVERSAFARFDAGSTRDAVSGARNAAFLSAFLTHAVALAKRRNEPISLLCIGTDYAKPDSRSKSCPEVADAWLHRIARAMAGTLRTSDVVARLDDGRFMAVLPGAGVTDALVIAEAVRRAAGEAGLASGILVPPTVSIGVAGLPDHAQEPGTLIAAAGEALARARSQGINRVALAPRPNSAVGSSITTAKVG
jgi:diguanylate cyclase (GGDEF)-like protein